jgi:hypothetical protein
MLDCAGRGEDCAPTMVVAIVIMAVVHAVRAIVLVK